jgi:hypothetical protein
VWDAEKGQELLTLKGYTTVVRSVAWSPDGRRIFAWDDTDKVLAWDTTTGQPTSTENPPPKPARGPVISPDGRLKAEPDGDTVAVTDSLKPAGSPWPFPDAADRKRYHSEQAADAEAKKQWFAAAFHLGRLLLDDPDNANLKKRRDQAQQAHAPQRNP